MKAAVLTYDRDFVPIHHHSSSSFGFPGQLNHMAVLNKRVQIQRNRPRLTPWR